MTLIPSPRNTRAKAGKQPCAYSGSRLSLKKALYFLPSSTERTIKRLLQARGPREAPPKVAPLFPGSLGHKVYR